MIFGEDAPMRRTSILLAATASVLTAVAGCTSSAPTVISDSPTPGERLVTGRSIASTQPTDAKPDPVAPIARQAVGSLPMSMVLSADRKYAIVSDMGYRASLSSIDVATGQRVGEIKFNRTRANATRGLYYGLALSTSNEIYAANGAAGTIAVSTLAPDGSLKPSATIKAQEGDFIAGLALDSRGVLFATSNDATGKDFPLNCPGTVIAFDTKTRREISRLDLPSYMGMSNFPLAIAVTPDGARVFAASQRDACLYVLDATDAAHLKYLDKIDTGSHPSALLLSHDARQLYVSNAGSDTVSFVDVASLKVTSTILLRPEAARALAGTTPLGLSLTPDGKLLFVALGDMNAVAQIDIEEEELEGYIPAGWYPSAVATDGKKLLVANAKGTTPRYPNPLAPTTSPTRQQSPNNLVEGDVLTRDLPHGADRKALTQQAVDLARMTPRYLQRGNPLATVGVKHVVYIVKENRTYDQILGDVPGGNGDPSRVIFGRDVTPNLHALAERFVLLDNFYDCGEVSGDGWTWSTQAMANEYVIRNVPYQYSGRGKEYDYEGQVNGYPVGGFPAKDPDGNPNSEHPAFRDGGKPIADVAAAPGGHLWDLCRKWNVPYRNWGFFLADSTDVNGVRISPDNIPAVVGLQPPGHDLAGISDIDFRKFDLEYADSEGPEYYYQKNHNAEVLRPVHTYGRHAAPSRFTEWKTEFDQLLAKDPTGAAVPAMMFVRFGNDHTSGLNGGRHTPRSMVADNDYACGQLVDALSHSPIWKDTAVFIIEDDAQNGPDHVDAHRSVCYVASPWIRKATVDHSFHNTVSCIRTMELLLGLPAMNGYDASADPMRFWDNAPTNDAPFNAIRPTEAILAEKNNAANLRQRVSPSLKATLDRSEKWNFAKADQAPAEELNALIWASVKGFETPMPPTPHGPQVAGAPPKKDDDD